MQKTKQSTYLIIGLGNPGEEYDHTFHNLGRMAGQKLQKDLKSFDFSESEKFLSLVSEGKLGKETFVIALPETFMNKSGRAVEILAKSYKAKPDHIIVIQDDADIRAGEIKIVKGKNSGGHKGIESIMRALKTKEFIRIRIGTTKSISKKGTWKDRDLMQTVVKKIPSSQKTLFSKGVRLAAAAAEAIIENGLDKAMSMVKRK